MVTGTGPGLVKTATMGDMAGSTTFPGGVDDFAAASPTRQITADSTGRTHSERHDDIEAAMEAVQTYILGRTPKITVASTAPSSPAVGDVWIDTT